MHFSYQGIKVFCMLSCELTLNCNSSLKLSLFKLLVVLLSLCLLTLNRLEGGGQGISPPIFVKMCFLEIEREREREIERE